jgi:hypothetical protein
MKSLIHLAAVFLGVAAAATIPADIIQRANSDPMEHGNYGQAGGQVWRFHQVAKGIFQGVPPEEWDDNGRCPVFSSPVSADTEFLVHIRNDTQPNLPTMEELYASPPPLNSPQASPNPARSLDVRAERSTCLDRVTCTAATGGTALWGASKWLATEVKSLGSDAWDGLNKPFFANLAGVGGQNLAITMLTTYALNKNGKAEPAQDCSTQMSQLDLLDALVQKICTQNPKATAFSVDVPYPDGSVRTLHVNSGNGTNLGGADVCGAPGIH